MSGDLPECYGVLYKFVPEYDADTPEDINAAILLLEPQFKGIVIRFKQVRFVEMGDSLKLQYSYDVVKGEVSPKDKPEFENTLGNLLYDLMLVKFQIDN